ncbi:isochorismatase family cysteine hydrolase [Streptomyces sp. Ag109_G2-15]|uniref:isochorismatase family cysteine hydrolase n=1 Tax=Streptomyces sp. Ag109_G2-15 TaxID=1938850 RepID=UPI000BDC5647|nr:isochorismatase family cysteine hydrolase [Streptomyces sp. Ag109_G2-15]SOD91449.1 Nicotinamidase-related amidase [Streptomyces sp. Ag109_G2-15]
MTSQAPYSQNETALLIVDPYNDFLSEGGKLWPRAKEVAEGVGLLDHMRTTLATARNRGFRVFIVPHHQTTPNDYITWDHLSPTQQRIVAHQTFAEGSWGAEWHPDFHPREDEPVIRQHWASSGFANTDLDLMLKQHHIRKILLIGMRANTCVDTTARFGQELGYHVTLIRDAIASFGWAEMTATFELNAPLYAHAILTTDEFVGIVNSGSGKGSP